MESNSRLSMASEAPLLRRMTNETVRAATTKSQTTLRAQSSPPLQSPPHTPQHNIWYRIKRALTRTTKVTSDAPSDHEPPATSEKEGRSFNSWSTGATKLLRRDRSGSESTCANTDNGGYVVTPASSLSGHRRHHPRHPKPQHNDTASFSGLNSPNRALNAERETYLQDTGSSRLFLRAPPFRHRQREKRTPVWEVFAVEEPTDEEQARRAFALLETCGAETASFRKSPGGGQATF
ncbi:hypothetical protein DBV05_g579 [Lasiodiplodia theobromae]|uniref:Uncharacterized protein n=1 Tax=Lasiodiplodia theobromae TaxID=45133 RepID=A0A5N5DRY2_9PEZI|nr:hypothetical protein DBV05_g579 [Lasiodiplodia theobromae]